jgi:hypothetical protein
LARGGEVSLPVRLDGVDAQLADNATVSILACGGNNNGIADNTPAVLEGISRLPNGGAIDCPPGVFAFYSSFVVPIGIILRGRGIHATIFKRKFTGDFITSFNGKSGLEGISIDGDTATYGAGRGVVMDNANSPKAHMLFTEIKNFVEPCLEFLDDAGDQFVAIGCNFYTTGAVNVVAAVKMGTDADASSKHFYACEGSGCTLFDFGGSGDIYVSGGYTVGLIFSATSNKVMINNMRWGLFAGRIAIRGASHHISNVVSAVPVDISGQHIKFDAEVPSYDITDTGTNNDIKIKGNRSYTCAWTGSVSDPVLGNGVLKAHHSRNGTNIKVIIDLVIGSTTTFGSGAWRFSLPRIDYNGVHQVCGSGMVQGVVDACAFQCRVRPGEQKVDLFYLSGGSMVNVGSASSTWIANATVRFELNYMTT